MAERQTYIIHVSGVPPGPNQHMHHMTRYRQCKGFTDEVAWQAAALRSAAGFPPPLEQAHVVATLRVRTARHFRDADNAAATLIPLVNGLKGRLIRDDSPVHMTLEVRQEIAPERGVTLEIKEVLDDNPTGDD